MVIILSISDEILKSIEIMIESAFNKRKTTEVYIGNISSVNSDGYTVKYNGKEIRIKTKATNVFKRNDIVKFCIPCGNKRNAFLLSELFNPVNYDGETLTASSVVYDNSSSGLDSTNVNGAIDEILKKLDEVKSLIVPTTSISEDTIDEIFNQIQ